MIGQLMCRTDIQPIRAQIDFNPIITVLFFFSGFSLPCITIWEWNIIGQLKCRTDIRPIRAQIDFNQPITVVYFSS